MNLGRDFKVEVTKGSDPGGQHKNKVETCAKVTYLPLKISETCQETRSKIKNVELAYSRLQDRIKIHNKLKKDEAINSLRKSQIGTGERTFRRRTYNFKTNIVTDHVTGKKANLQIVLNGELNLLK